MERGEKFNLSIFRLCSLWFENGEKDSTVNKLFNSQSQLVESRKFLPLLNQLTARLGVHIESHSEDFQFTLMKLVARIAADHPHHSLFQIFSIVNPIRENLM